MGSDRHSSFYMVCAACIMAMFVTGCSSSDPGEDEAAPLTAEQVLGEAAEAMATVGSASFTIEQKDGRVFIDDDEQLAFQSADGRFAAPASSEALLSVDALGFATEVGAIAIDGELWFTNPLTGEWTVAPESFTFDPADLFAAETGFTALLTEAAESAELIDDPAQSDDPDLGERYQVRAPVSAERVEVLTGGLVSQATDIDLWIDAETRRIVEVRFALALDDTVSNWRMTITDYNAEVTIAPPELTTEG
jgi:lipoprotein LprG